MNSDSKTFKNSALCYMVFMAGEGVKLHQAYPPEISVDEQECRWGVGASSDTPYQFGQCDLREQGPFKILRCVFDRNNLTQLLWVIQTVNTWGYNLALENMEKVAQHHTINPEMIPVMQKGM